MRTRFIVALLLVILQIVTILLMTESRIMPGFLFIATALTCLPHRPWRLSLRTRILLYFALAIGSVVKSYFFPLSPLAFSPIMSSTTALTVAQYLLALQILHLLLDKHRLPPQFPLLSIGVFAFAGSIVDYGRLYLGFATMALHAIVLLLLYFMLAPTPDWLRPDPRTAGRYAIRFGAMTVVIALGLIVANLLRLYQEDLDLLFTRFVRVGGTSTEIGLSDFSGLRSVTHYRSRNEDRVALRVVSHDAPPYMRARAFATYQLNQWAVGVTRWARDAVPDTIADGDDGLHLFTVLHADFEGAHRLEVWPAPVIAGPLFAPVETAAYRAAAYQIMLDDHRIAEAPDRYQGSYFEAYVPARPVEPALHESTRAAALAIPPSVGPSVRDLAQTLFEDADTADEKIHAVLQYFAQYDYQVGITIPRDQNPLSYFLTERPPAHCEYFATGAAILLRLGGIPARYVTGFVPTEYNPFGQCWIARNKDAHAWTEAYVEGRGWVTVDATPPDGQPQQAPRSPVTLALDGIRFRIQEFLALTRTDLPEAMERLILGLSTILMTLIASSLIGWTIAGGAVLLVAAMLIRRVVRWRRGRVAKQHRYPLHPQVCALERRLRRHGVTRGPAETLHRFAARLERDYPDQSWAREAAQWLRAYANARYSRARGASGNGARV